MKRLYEELELEVIRFEAEDVITESAPNTGNEGEIITVGGGTTN